MIDNVGDLAEIIANTDPDAKRLQDLTSEIMDILRKRDWPGVVVIIAEATKETINDISCRYLDLESQNQLRMLVSSSHADVLVNTVINLDQGE